MLNIDELIPTIREDSLLRAPLEACGVVINFKGKQKYIPCRNNYTEVNNFILDPVDYANAEDLGDVICIVHSHVTQDADFSKPDILCLNKGEVPWAVYSIVQDKLSIRYPEDVIEDYINRQYIYTVQDCYTLIQDYYKKEYGIQLGGPDRPNPLDKTLGAGLYRAFQDYGFKEIPLTSLRKGDCLIICNSSAEPNHAAIYLEGNRILHHASGRLSCREILGSYWIKNTWKCVRHESFL